MERKYQWKWRIANGFLALFLLASAALPIVEHLWQNDRYQLSSAATNLVGQTDSSLAKQLTYDAKTATYQFNKDAIKTDASGSDLPAALQKNSVGAADKSNTKTYALDVPEDFSKGVTYHDTNSGLSFSLVPQFSALNAKREQGHVVFPLDGGNQAIYTLKNNGLKEDLVVPKITEDSMAFNYKLNLPDTLEAKVIPGSGGVIGIYSADPSLFGDISYGSSKDQAAVTKARKNGTKTSLVFGLPAPVIKATDGANIGNATARFILQGNKLSVVAEQLAGIKTAITIDPSVVVTSSSDFQTGGNNEGNIDFSTSGQITRGGLTGGTVGTWTDTTNSGSAFTAASGVNAVAYNGYLYEIGGDAANRQLYYAPLNSNGTVGAWAGSSTALNTPRMYAAAVAYNGYMYVYAGYNNTTNTVNNTVEYAPINSSTGAVGAMTTVANTMASAICRQGYAVYNGYLYATGGANIATPTCASTSTPTTTVQYAPILGTGSVGTWVTSSNQFATARFSNGTVAYNGYLYVIGGTNGGTNYADTQYAPLNADGSIGTWVTSTNSTPFAVYRFGATVYNGYIYVIGGTYSAVAQAETWIAPINANGSLGAWQVNVNTLSSGRYGSGAAVYNGYQYYVGGYTGSVYTNTVSYSKIDPDGMNTAFSTAGNTVLPAAARNYAGAVAYNGYVYVMGGSSTTTVSATGSTNVIYAALNPNGTIGTWNTGSTFVSSRVHSGGGVAVYNGYLYYIAGQATSVSNSNEVQYAQINTTNGSVGAWTDTTAIGVGRISPSAWAYNGNLYYLGGYHTANDTACNATTSQYCSDVYMAPLNTNGTVGTWAAQTSITGATAGATVILRGSQIYAIGGDGTSATQVYFATMAANGSITSWVSLTSIGTSRTVAMGGYYNGYIYVWGNNSARTGNIATGQYARVNSDGTLAVDSGCGVRWCAIAPMSSATLGGRSGFIYGGFMYTIGGADGSAASTAVESATVNNGGNGNLGIWTTSASTFVNARYNASTVAYNGYLYMMGGYNGTTVYSDVQYAPILASGDIGSWVTLTATPLYTSLYSFGAQVYNGYLYVMGGNDGTTQHGDVYYSKIKNDGTLGLWTATNGFTTSARSTFGSTTYNGYIYVLGGIGGGGVALSSVYYAAINSDGTLGSWASTTAFATARNAAGAFAVNGNIYIFGGTTSTYLSDVQYAPLNAGTGAVGTWAATTSLAYARAYSSASFLNGNVYLAGGFDGTNYFNDVQYASVNANGTLGSWTTATNKFTLGRYGHNVVTYGGNMYIVGGYTGSAYKNDTQFAPISSIARTSKYSKLIDLGAPENVTSVSYNGSLTNGLSSISYQTADSTGVFGANALASTPITTTGNCVTSANSIRYLFVTFTLDDSANAAYSDTLGPSSLVTDFTINYLQGHPSPNIRLRTGQTLQAGVLGQLDTCI